MNNIPIAQVKPNKGQIAGLPANPRKYSKLDIDALAASIEETPTLLIARPILAVKQGDEYIAIAGNARLEACKKLGMKEVPVQVIEEDIDTIKAMVIKDNGHFGDWDTDLLEEDWGDLPLQAWGCETLTISDSMFDEVNAGVNRRPATTNNEGDWIKFRVAFGNYVVYFDGEDYDRLMAKQSEFSSNSDAEAYLRSVLL